MNPKLLEYYSSLDKQVSFRNYVLTIDWKSGIPEIINLQIISENMLWFTKFCDPYVVYYITDNTHRSFDCPIKYIYDNSDVVNMMVNNYYMLIVIIK